MNPGFVASGVDLEDVAVFDDVVLPDLLTVVRAATPDAGVTERGGKIPVDQPGAIDTFAASRPIEYVREVDEPESGSEETGPD